MKNWISRLFNSGPDDITIQPDRALERTCAGRIVSALTFLIVIFCLSLWITVFLLLRDTLFSDKLAANISTNLTCITFFGGLVTAIFVGALAGNYLRRAFWRILIKRNK